MKAIRISAGSIPLRIALLLLGAASAAGQSTLEIAAPAEDTPVALPDPAVKSDSGAKANADDLDSLLDAADKDVAQLGRVDVTAAPSLAEVVTSVERQPSTVGKTPAAVFVVTQEMIRRSGVNNIPDVLRLVPGVEVARLDANKWAITSRGFNSLYAYDMLVQIDGRAVYSQFFSGVFWDMQDVVLEDIERIEVVRGPGATVWGANAVNGVINIITKSSAETQGLLVRGGTGTEERGFSALRYGGKAGENLNWRVYGKQFNRDGGYYFGDDFDDWRQASGGFRADWTPTPDDTVTFQGALFDGDSGTSQVLAFPTPPFQNREVYDSHNQGENGIVRWTRNLDEETSWTVQSYYDRYHRVTPFTDIEQQTADFDFQYRFPLGQRHNVICGAGYRRIEDHFFGDFSLSVDPTARSTNLYSCFIQDQITLQDDEWYLFAGSKFEHNDFSGFEYQPSVRLLWTPTERQTMWAAVSRAVRTPNRIDDDFIFNRLLAPPPPFPTFAQFTADRSFEAEDLLAYELGYRAQPMESFSWDLATFYNQYSDLSGAVSNGAPFFDPTIPAVIVPFRLANVLTADTYGAELATTYQMSPDWKLSGAYTLLYLDVHAPLSDGIKSQGSSPHNQMNIRSSWNLRSDLDFDLVGRYVDNLPSLGVSSYLTMDARLAWRPWKNLEWAFVGRNLLDDRHSEFVDLFGSTVATEVQSEFFTTLTWKR